MRKIREGSRKIEGMQLWRQKPIEKDHDDDKCIFPVATVCLILEGHITVQMSHFVKLSVCEWEFVKNKLQSVEYNIFNMS